MTRNGEWQAADRKWRLIRHGPATGAENMAIDEAIGRAVAEHLVLPTLRFYAWDPPCVSLGRHQPLAAVDLAYCARLGYHVVRRPTGGRAILHTDELTYSVTASPEHPVMVGSVLDAYLRLARGLATGLQQMGIPAQTAPATKRAGQDASAACFEVPSAYEIVVNGRKLLGSAQNRRAGFVLQHGSLPLVGDLTRLIDCLKFPSEAERDALRRSLAHHATTVEEVTGHWVTFDEAATALTAGFENALGIELVPGDLTETERTWAAELTREKYDHLDWTGRV